MPPKENPSKKHNKPNPKESLYPCTKSCCWCEPGRKGRTRFYPRCHKARTDDIDDVMERASKPSFSLASHASMRSHQPRQQRQQQQQQAGRGQKLLSRSLPPLCSIICSPDKVAAFVLRELWYELQPVQSLKLTEKPKL